MTVGLKLVAAAGTLLVASLSVSARQEPPVATSPPPSPLATAPTSSDYLGSESCARCHQEDVDQWKRSLHIRMTKPIAEATVLGDFTDGTRLSDHGRTFEFGRANGRPFIRVTAGTSQPETFPVDYTLGFKRYQGYLSKLADGRMYVLPAFWHVDSRRWLDWKEITPIPDETHGLRQIWNTNCFNCHATNLAQGFDPQLRRYETTWTEMGVGCEACHGPGRAHVELMDAWEKDPATKPAYDNSARNRDLSAILKTFSPRSRPARQTYDTCAYCHGNKRNMFLGFRGGDRYEDYALPFLVSAPIPDNDLQGEFWPDGRPNRFNRPQALTLSGCFKAGEVVCTNCHVAHGSRHPFSLKLNITQGRAGDLLCTQCHGSGAEGVGGAEGAGGAVRAGGAEVGAEVRLRLPRAKGLRADATVPWPAQALEAHTFHRVASAGSRCIGCHMSDVNWRLLMRRRDHTFQPPVPEMTTAFGVPNACTTCHDDRTPEWAVTEMDRWWSDGERRQAALAVADTMYRAGSGDRAVLPALARLAVDRSHGMLIRASAVEFMGQLARGTARQASADLQSQTAFRDAPVAPAARRSRPPVQLSPTEINALIGAASDPEPVVRAQAVSALVAAGQRERVVTPIVARLIDPARVVRARAVEALLALGIAQLPGAAGQALARAQDDYARALSDFPDIAANHSELAWLNIERDRVDQAAVTLETAIRLDPAAARPWVIKGVLAARAGRYDEAQALWRKARNLDPGYPNVDQLIAEAEKRKGR